MVMLSPRREVGEFRKRYKWMALFVVFFFAVLLVRTVQLQLVQNDHWAEIARENITKTISLPATRGIIRDSRGRIIATNRASYDVYLTPQLLADGDIDRVSELMNLEPEERIALIDRVRSVPLRRRTHSIEMFNDISRDQLAALETHQNELPGVDVVPRPVRTYPYGALGAHAVGYLNEVNAEDLEAHVDRDYRAGDSIGRMGLEKGWEETLRGERGHRRVWVDARGRRQRNASLLTEQREETQPPTPGADVVTTLDMELMRTIRDNFHEPAGSVVVVEVNTGRIRALFSKPSYNLNDISGGMSQAAYDELRTNPFRPLIDKTIYESYFPGSTFKPVSALAALQDEVVDPSERVECIGYYMIGTDRKRCTSAHGAVDMRQAIVQSCNVYFYQLAEHVGLERLTRFARDFGFGERTQVGINSEASGFLATRDWYIRRHGRFRVGDTLNTAIGQGNTRVTLLQLALAYGALANGGALYEPQLIESVRRPDGSVIEEFEPQVDHQIAVNRDHFTFMETGLRGVVNAQSGTAYEARIEGGVDVAGKTGTAEIQPGPLRDNVDPRRAWYFRRSHAWFAGYAPTQNPELAIVVLVEHGGSGGRAAAPIAMRILQDHLGSRATTTARGPSTPSPEGG